MATAEERADSVGEATGSAEGATEQRDHLSTADLAGLTEAQDAAATREEPLLPADDAEGFRSRWESIQTGFVDEPRRSVESADQLVAELMQRLATGFSQARSGLEQQWDRGDDVSTEDLRVTLQRYRSFFERLLAA